MCVRVSVRVSLHACMHCRLKSQTGSTSLIPLSRFTAMLMWDLHQNGWCTAQTEPMSQLESLRNDGTHTNTHTQGDTQSLSHTISVSHYLSLSDTSAYSQSPLSLSLSLTHTHIYTQTHPTPSGDSASGLFGWRRENAETVELRKESENKTEKEQVRKKETGAASQAAQDEQDTASSNKMLQKSALAAVSWLYQRHIFTPTQSHILKLKLHHSMEQLLFQFQMKANIAFKQRSFKFVHRAVNHLKDKQ